MATYFHQHHHHHHHANPSDIQSSDAGLQTLILMNHPSFAGYSETTHAPNALYHAPPPLLPQLVGVPLHSSSDTHALQQQLYAAWAPRGSPRAQQGLSLTLSRTAHADPDPLHPSPSGESESPTATATSAGDVAVLITPSKYLKAAQELLDEVVNVSVDRVRPDSSLKKIRATKGESPPDDSVAGDRSKEPAELTPADRQELQMKKAKLINLLDEVEQRQRQYHQHMQTLVASFEQVAGPNSARTYTSLALKTISSQFRSLRSGISSQIRAANKSLGEEEPGTGSTSRLKMLDHQMRQQRALQQLGMIQNNAWRPQRGLPEKAVSVLRAWLFEHFLHPYPKDSDKLILAKKTGLSRSQVSNWFINARVRLWKPMIEEMYAEEVKEHQQQTGTDNKDEPSHEKANRNLLISDDEPAKADNDPFALVDNEAQGSCLKKQRNYDFTFPDSGMFSNGCKEEEAVDHQAKQDDDCSIMPGSGSGFMGGLVSYPIGEIGRFGDGQFPANFASNGVSLTLGLPHCESLSLQGNTQAFLGGNSGMDEYRGRIEMGQLNPSSSHSGNAYGAQLLHDFVAG